MTTSDCIVTKTPLAIHQNTEYEISLRDTRPASPSVELHSAHGQRLENEALHSVSPLQEISTPGPGVPDDDDPDGVWEPSEQEDDGQYRVAQLYSSQVMISTFQNDTTSSYLQSLRHCRRPGVRHSL